MNISRTIIAALAILLFSSHACERNDRKAEEDTEVDSRPAMDEVPDQISFRYAGDHTELWLKVDSLEKNGLYRSALDVVQTIYTSSLEHKNAPQVVKCLMYKMKYNSYIADDDFILTLNELNDLSANQSFPLKQIIHSITAEAYWGYYQSNRWLFMNRSRTVNFKQDDVRTWDLDRILNHSRKHYLLSMEHSDSLKATQIRDFKDMLVLENGGEEQRPTLYDFLAHRALDYFMNDESGLTRSSDRFTMKGEQFFTDELIFATSALVPAGDSSNIGFAVRIFQDLSNHHGHRSKAEPRVDLLLKRLKFAKYRSTDLEKDNWYTDALHRSTATFKNEPAVAEIYFEIAKYLNEKGDQYNGKNSEKRWLKKDALAICKNTINEYPGSFGAKQCEGLQVQIQSKHLQFKTEDSYIPSKKGTFLIEFKNVDSIYFRLVKLPWDFYFKNGLYGYDLAQHLLSIETLKEWNVTTTNPGDHQLHRTELPITLPEYGHYAIIASPNANFALNNNAIVHTSIWASRIAYSYRNNYSEDLEIMVNDRENGGPIKNARVTTYIRKYDYFSRKNEIKAQETLTTDANGMVRIKSKEDYRYLYIDVVHQNDRYNNSHIIYQYSPYREEKSYSTTNFFSDRSIYRPGQTIHFKGIRITHNGDVHKVVPNKKVTVSLLDANYQKISELNLTTNEYGTFTGSFKLPEGGLNGQMHIQDELNSHFFSVEEYKRPRFEIEMDKVAGNYRLNDSIYVTGTAKAYAGSTIDNAQVSYRVVRGCHFPYWHWYRGSYPYIAETEINNGVVTTEPDGTFIVPFKALDDPSIQKSQQPNYYYKVLIDVTDINGETQSTETWVRVGYNCLALSLVIPQSIEKDQSLKFKLNANNLNGVPLPTQGQITIQRVIEPKRIYRSKLWEVQDIFYFDKASYEELFENDSYEDELHLDHLPLSEILNSRSFNTAETDSVELKELGKLEPGRYKIISKTIDPFGEVVEDIRFITLLDKKSKKNPSKDIFLVNPMKTLAEPGEKASFLISSGTKLKVFYEIEHKNVIIHSEWIELNESQQLIEIPIIEAYRGNITVHFSAVRMGRNFNHRFDVSVPHSDKVLDVEFETFRDKLQPGQKEKWRITIKGPKGEKVAAELLATMYDASLDAFRSNSFYLNVFQTNYSNRYWSSSTFEARDAQSYQDYWNSYVGIPYRGYYELNRFGYYGSYGRNYHYFDAVYDGEMAVAEEQTLASVTTVENKRLETISRNSKDDDYRGDKSMERTKNEQEFSGSAPSPVGGFEADNNLGSIQTRKNFSETAFFYPQLRTNDKGEVVIEFTAPESLTKWTILGLAHSKDLKTGTFRKELVTQKELMILSNAPRFLREHDEIYFSSKVSNLSDKDLNGEAMLQLIDPNTDQVIDVLFANTDATQEFDVKKGQSAELKWKIKIPEGLSFVKYKIMAKSGNFTDGEEMILPILTNRMLVTEAMPIWMRGEGTKDFRFEKLMHTNSPTLKHHSLTLEFTSNPAWYAIQAMPYMMEYPYECAEQIFTRFYANSLATEMMNSNPEIKSVFEKWESESPESLLSSLEKNQELKSLLLEETPWVLEAQNESERKKRIGLLFNLNKMSRELERSLSKLEQMQVSNGGWPWFKGMEDSPYITQHIVTGLGHLDALGVKDVRANSKVWNMTQKAVAYLDARIAENYNLIKKQYPNYRTEQHISNLHVQYLYVRSYFRDIDVSSSAKEAMAYFDEQAKTYWRQFNLYNEGMIALWAHRNSDIQFAQKIMASLRERAIESDELGMYWKDNTGGYYWYQAPIETQALLIEAFDEINNDQATVEALQIWLLRNKQTNDWKTTKATAEACYALLRRGSNLLTTESNTIIELGEIKIPTSDPGTETEAGIGYFKRSWEANEIDPKMGEITVQRTGQGIGWGAVYWQYFEDLDKITAHETPLSMKKDLFKVVNTNSGPVITPITEHEKLKPGDKIKVRIELRSDRDMEYVHLKDMRASGLEPVNVFSGYRWQDGLSYYESTKDASTNFFIEILRKGTYVFEYELVVSQAGNFSNGISSIQCMYAPEFTSHSAGKRIVIEKL